MGTYFALMDEAAKRGEDYESIEQISETLRKIQNGTAQPDEFSRAIAFLTVLGGKIEALVKQSTSGKATEEEIARRQEAVKHLESLKEAIRSAAESSLSAARK